MFGAVEKITFFAQTLPPKEGVFLFREEVNYMVNKKEKRIMYYDEAQKIWVVDTMEVEENDQQDEPNHISSDNKNAQGGAYAYV